MARMTRSGPPPTALGKTSRVGFDGQAWGCAPDPAAMPMVAAKAGQRRACRSGLPCWEAMVIKEGKIFGRIRRGGRLGEPLAVRETEVGAPPQHLAKAASSKRLPDDVEPTSSAARKFVPTATPPSVASHVPASCSGVGLDRWRTIECCYECLSVCPKPQSL